MAYRAYAPRNIQSWRESGCRKPCDFFLYLFGVSYKKSDNSKGLTVFAVCRSGTLSRYGCRSMKMRAAGANDLATRKLPNRSFDFRIFRARAHALSLDDSGRHSSGAMERRRMVCAVEQTEHRLWILRRYTPMSAAWLPDDSLRLYSALLDRTEAASARPEY